MDTLSHALWGYAVTRWRGPKTARWGAVMGAAPDVLYSGASMGRRLLRGESLTGSANNPAIWRRDGPPTPPDLLNDYYDFYRYTHSLVLLAGLVAVWWLIRRKSPWPLLAWGLHILMDIPSHERYLTPFLFPLSDVTVMGYAWSRPPMLIANLAGLAIAYGLVYWHYWRRNRPTPTEPWPEAQS